MTAASSRLSVSVQKRSTFGISEPQISLEAPNNGACRAPVPALAGGDSAMRRQVIGDISINQQIVVPHGSKHTSRKCHAQLTEEADKDRDYIRVLYNVNQAVQAHEIGDVTCHVVVQVG